MATLARNEIEAALERLVLAAPQLLRRWRVNPDSCVLATRATCLALAAVGVRASAFPTRLDVFSPSWIEQMRAGWDPRQPADPDRQRELAERGVWTVAIGDPQGEGRPRPDGRPGYNAHLLCLVDGRWLVDMTLHQAARPQKGIDVQPHLFAADRELLRGERPQQMLMRGSLVQYRRLAAPQFTRSVDWTQLRPGAAEVVQVRDLLTGRGELSG